MNGRHYKGFLFLGCLMCESNRKGSLKIKPMRSMLFRLPQTAYNRGFSFGGDLGFDGGCEANAGIPSFQ
jgi:hypothetical protein